MRAPPKLLYLYLGRHGAMPRFALDLARASAPDGAPAPVVIAAQNELAKQFSALPNPVTKLRLFDDGRGALLQLGRVSAARRALADSIAVAKPDAVVELMPHIWSPFMEGVMRRAGVPRIAILHDWRAHPGDGSGVANSWLRRSALRANRIVTLSRYVATEIGKSAPEAAALRVTPLFHPDLAYRSSPLPAAGPLRVLFLGRLLAYKGLDLCVGAVARAQAGGSRVELTVAGAGDIVPLLPSLDRVGAKVINTWLDHADIDRLLGDCHVVAATYREASQSGVVAAAFGAGRPVLATPVGALPEQVAHERTGLVAAEATIEAVTAALSRFASAPDLVAYCAAEVQRTAPERSMAAFGAMLASVTRALD